MKNDWAMDNSSKLIEAIKEKQIMPIPKWRFILKDTAIWILFFMSVIFGALAFSIILFAIQQADFDLVSQMSGSWDKMIMGLVPLIWIIGLVICIVIAILSIKNSKKGYRFSAIALVGYGTALSILIGTLFFISGGAHWLENIFAKNISPYESVEERKTRVWSNPGEGFLSGTIISVRDSTFELTDLKGKAWEINFAHSDIVPAVSIEEGEKIKMTGLMTSDDTFRADMIRPWGGFQHRYHGGRKNN